MPKTVEPLKDEDLPEDLTVVRRLPRGDGEELLVGVQRFRGKNYAIARIYYAGEDGKLKPTKRGINVHEELLPDIIQALQDVDKLLMDRPAKRG